VNIEGKITLRLHWDGQRIVRVALEPRHHLQVADLLRGKPAVQAAHTVPLLFSLCAKAQAAAVVTALEAAQGTTPGVAAAKWRELMVLGEAIQEFLWRFLLDLPGLMGEPRQPELLIELRRRFAHVVAPVLGTEKWKTPGAELPEPEAAAWEEFSRSVEAVISADILGMPIADWVEAITVGQTERWLRASATPTARLLLKLWNGRGLWNSCSITLMQDTSRARVLNELLPALENDPDFALRPHWRGQAMETGALARMRSHPLLAGLLQENGSTVLHRLLARLVELLELTRMLRAPVGESPGWVQSATVRQGTGLAWVQTARGLLVHRAELDESGNVRDYRIVAPTEWNFHPDGACVHGLTGRAAVSADEARHFAELMVQSLDPCVAYELEVCNA
jgi:coenzyme F420-reducing hydrogenase alpha subunit